MFNWKKLLFWRKVAKPLPIFVPEEEIILATIYDPIDEQQDEVVKDWEESINVSDFYKNEHAEHLVNLFKQKLVAKYGFKYFSSGGSSNVYLSPCKTYVVKLAQVMGGAAPYDCYARLMKEVDVAPESWDESDKQNYLSLRKVYKAHVCCPHKISKDSLFCVQKYFPQDAYSKSKIIQYFNGILGNYQIQCWRRATTYQDIGTINNMVWDEENNKAWIIDIH